MSATSLEPRPARSTTSLSRLAKHEGTTRLVYREIVANGPLAERLTKSLFEPLLDRVCAEIRAGGRVEPDMEPFIATLFVHLSFSHVALAPLLSRLFDRDMLSPESVARPGPRDWSCRWPGNRRSPRRRMTNRVDDAEEVETMGGPMNGVKIVDLSIALAGPWEVLEEVSK